MTGDKRGSKLGFHRKRGLSKGQANLNSFFNGFPSEIGVQSTSTIPTPEMLETLRGIHEYRTVRQIANSRRVSVFTIYKALRRLREKGYLSPKNEVTGLGIAVLSGGLRSSQKNVRLHDVRFLVEILRFGDPAWKRRRRSYLEMDQIPHTVKRLQNNDIVGFALDRWRVEVTTRSFMLYPPDVFTDDAHMALLGLFVDAKEVVKKLEKRFDVVCLEKGERLNIRVVGTHAALVNNALAKVYNAERRQFEVRDAEGVLRVIIDNSLRLQELEAVSPMFAPEDAGVMQDFIRDLLANPVTMSVIVKELMQVREVAVQVAELQKTNFTLDVGVQARLKRLEDWVRDAGR